MYTQAQATQIVLDFMERGTVIRSAIEHEGEYLFIAVRPDPEEGEYDPFIKVNAKTGKIRDFSPQEYDTPRLIIEKLVENSI